MPDSEVEPDSSGRAPRINTRRSCPAPGTFPTKYRQRAVDSLEEKDGGARRQCTRSNCGGTRDSHLARVMARGRLVRRQNTTLHMPCYALLCAAMPFAIWQGQARPGQGSRINGRLNPNLCCPCGDYPWRISCGAEARVNVSKAALLETFHGLAGG